MNRGSSGRDSPSRNNRGSLRGTIGTGGRRRLTFPRRSFPIVLVFLTFLLGDCAEVQAQPAADSALPADQLPYPAADPGLGESLYSNEQVLAGRVASVIEKALREQYQSGNARRDAHPKAHGCVKASFHVDDALPESLAKGIFIPGKTYQTWIRFSNGSKDASRSDSKGDARGMAIKVLGVPGKKLLESEQNAKTQDFILINHPVFFASDPTRYLSFSEKAASSSFVDKLTLPFSLGLKGTLIALQTARSKISNPLNTRYWSTVPYQLGTGPERQAIKVSAKPCSAETHLIPKSPGRDYLRPGRDYLRAALSATLHSGDACMVLLVQPRTSDRLSVEDSMTEWKESQAPFHKVATILIPQQDFDTPEQNLFCENLSFTPWHSLPEHRPLGATNRLRKVIYEHISRVRHEMNSTVKQEP